MKLFIFCIIFSIFLWMGSSSPINPKRVLVNRPTIHSIYKRAPQKYVVMYAKGQKPGVKVYNPTPPPQLRKGQYMCGNRVCRLQPGEIPKGCNGMCQYAV